MTCDRIASGPDYLIAVAPTEQAFASSNWSAEYFLNFHAPTQTKMGCFEFDPPCSEVLGVCLIGPKNKINREDTIEGKPGSACPGETRHDGLCVAQVEQVEEVTESPKPVEAKTDDADVTTSESNSYFVSF